VLTASGGIVEIQGTAERHPFSETQLMEMMALAKKGCQHLFEVQMQAVRTAKP
jgi:ribonuclease PH